MSHKQIFLRYLVVVFWLFIIGGAITAVLNAGNFMSLGFFTIMLYVSIGIPAIFSGVIATKILWNYK